MVRFLVVFVCATIIKYHRLSDLNNRHLFSYSSLLEAGSLRSGHQHSWFLVQALSGLHTASLCPQIAKETASSLVFSSYKGSNSIIMRGPPS